METEACQAKRELQGSPAVSPVAKRTRSPAARNPGSGQSSIAVPLNPLPRLSPPPALMDIGSVADTVALPDSGRGTGSTTSQLVPASSSLQLPTFSPIATASGTSTEELFKAIQAAASQEIKDKEDQIGALKGERRELESRAAAATNAAVAASSHAAAVEATARV